MKFSSFRDRKRWHHRFVSLTAYNYPTARILDEMLLDFILVGDSLGMVELGHPDTTAVTLQDIVSHTKAVARGASKIPIVSDLPYKTYETPEAALISSKALLEAGAGAVKLEGGDEVLDQVRELTKENIPVMGHLGMLPQHIKEEGGKYCIKGREAKEAEALKRQALALEEAGAFAIVLELVSPPLAKEISESLEIPTIGIGSGPDCDGQVLVFHDLVGLSPWFKPGFAKSRASLASEIRRAVHEYIDETRGKAAAED
ncbi:MAG: 3-methyl-2-oxobutanoate hydroxymethyltransferase [Chthoniobacterales bacterium]